MYHKSQRFTAGADGSLTVEMDVCDDSWLRGLILQFGHKVRVLGPPELARAIADELQTAAHHYAEAMGFDGLGVSSALLDLSAQSRLPF
jgi:predicted DNA-binding transcriptional regulator YafY